MTDSEIPTPAPDKAPTEAELRTARWTAVRTSVHLMFNGGLRGTFLVALLTGIANDLDFGVVFWEPSLGVRYGLMARIVGYYFAGHLTNENGLEPTPGRKLLLFGLLELVVFFVAAWHLGFLGRKGEVKQDAYLWTFMGIAVLCAASFMLPSRGTDAEQRGYHVIRMLGGVVAVVGAIAAGLMRTDGVRDPVNVNTALGITVVLLALLFGYILLRASRPKVKPSRSAPPSRSTGPASPCTSSLPSGSSCTPTCDSGYRSEERRGW